MTDMTMTDATTHPATQGTGRAARDVSVTEAEPAPAHWPGLISTGRRHGPPREWTDGAFPVLDPRGFYSTSGACSVSPFTTIWSTSRPPNKIEHRLFSFITQNWRGKPLISRQVIVQLIAARAAGLVVLERCWVYPGAGSASNRPRRTSVRSSPLAFNLSRTHLRVSVFGQTTGPLRLFLQARTRRFLDPPIIRRVDEDVAILIPHSSGCADFPLPVLHGRALLARV
jgi:Rhodopirellula transposase DDE domain